MAGIGFELRRMMRGDTFAGVARAYAYAGLVSAGPWLLSIFGLLAVALLTLEAAEGTERAQRFLVSVTHLIAISLIVTGLLQLTLTRFFADRLFEGDAGAILPNLAGALVGVTLVTGGVGGVLALTVLSGSPAYRVLLVANLVALSGIWLLVLFLTSLKVYRTVVLVFAAAYLAVIGGAYGLVGLGVEGLLLALLLGHGVLFFALFALVARWYPSASLLQWSFLGRRRPPWGLAAAGLLYNAGVWADKALFWYVADTAHTVVAPLHANAVYDLPVFLAYLFVVPGLAVNLVALETDFADSYDAFYAALLGGDTLETLESRKADVTLAARNVIYETTKWQALTTIIVLAAAPRLLGAIGVDQAHWAVFRVALVGVSGQMVLLSALNILFYLNQPVEAAWISSLLLVANAGLTLVTIELGPAFYGYGFAGSVFVSALVALVVLSRRLRRWEYRTFTRQ